MNEKIKKISETAILISLAITFDIISKAIPFLNMHQGGHVSISMLPLLIIGIRNGYKYGFIGGFVYAIINFMLDGFFLHWGSIFFDYIFAFSIFGITGFFKNKIKNVKIFVLVCFIPCFIRYLFHSFSGVLFFKQYAYLPSNWHIEEDLVVFVYSFIYYNLPYMILSTLFSISIGVILYTRKVIYLKEEVDE